MAARASNTEPPKSRLIANHPRDWFTADVKAIGIATLSGRIQGVKEPLSVFTLKVHRLELEGRWIVVDRRFIRLGEAAEEL